MVEVKRSISSPAGVEPLQRLAIAPDTLGQGADLPLLNHRGLLHIEEGAVLGIDFGRDPSLHGTSLICRVCVELGWLRLKTGSFVG